MNMAVEIGDKAPEFILKDQNMQDVSLSDFSGQLVALAFFPLAFSPICTLEMSSFSADLEEFNAVNAQLLGVSVDSPFVLKAFADKQQINYPLLSDFNKEASRAYGVLDEDVMGLKGVAKRSIFIIDGTGTIRYKWVADHPGMQPNYAEVMEEIERISAQAAAK
jgi:peroxiredoxin